MTGDRGVLLVPQKDLDQAKGRMLLPPQRRRELAVDMLRQTLAAAAGVQFAAVVVVLDNLADAEEIADLDVIPYWSGRPGLNESLTAAERMVRSKWGDVPLTVMPSDLPLATAELLEQALSVAERYERAFLPDICTGGTTMLFAGPEAPLRPAYGPHSAHAHEKQGARRLINRGLDLLRHDVDDLADLLVAHLRFEERQRWEQTG
jgi:2-phospho-L-lactate/phosphoenolpyruvate guanylyltransferase